MSIPIVKDPKDLISDGRRDFSNLHETMCCLKKVVSSLGNISKVSTICRHADL
jgi:hypothetical protein